MKQILKFRLSNDGLVSLPKGYQILSVQIQNIGHHQYITLWILGDLAQSEQVEQFGIYPTGTICQHSAKEFLATLQFNSGLIYHIFAPYPELPKL